MSIDTPPDLATGPGVLQFCEEVREAMAETFREHGEFECNGFSFCAYVFATHDPAPPANGGHRPEDWRIGPKLDRVQARLVRFPSFMMAAPATRHTAMFGKLVRDLARMTRGLGTLLISETWMVHSPAGEKRSPEAYRDSLPESLEHAPGRRETLFMRLEHEVAGNHTWSAEILRDPTRLEPWKPLDYDKLEGRLANLSPTSAGSAPPKSPPKDGAP